MASTKKTKHYLTIYVFYYLYKDNEICKYKIIHGNNPIKAMKYGCKQFIEDKKINDDLMNIVCFYQGLSKLYMLETNKNIDEIEVSIVKIPERKTDYYIIEDIMIIYDSIQKLEIPENIKTLFILQDHYFLVTNFTKLNNLPYSVENMIYFGCKGLLKNSTNLPITLKNLYVKKNMDINIEELKLPFGCIVIKL